MDSLILVEKGSDHLARSREEIIRESMDSPKRIDETIEFKIPRSVQQYNESKHKYKCSCCGRGFTNLKNNFHKTNGILFQSNDGYLPWCKDCADKYLVLLTSLYSNNEEHAIEHYCQQADWTYDIEILKQAREISSDRSRISHYSAKKNLNVGKRRTFVDTIKFEYENRKEKPVESINDIEDLEEYKLTPKMIKFWGAGYDPSVYPTLQGYYDELLKLCEGRPDVRKQKMMKNLCLLEYQMSINIQAGKDIGTLSNSYKTMFEAAELKNNDADTSNDVFGQWIMDIEKYSPAEYYKDKKKYHDFFGIIEYIERFMYRPLKNLILGTKEKEKEYWIDDDDKTDIGEGDQ